MVNRGGPSKACRECRRRKIRCSLERPHCSQCTRVGKVCPGYRSLDNLIFRPFQSREGDDSSRSETSASQQSTGKSSTSREELGYLAVPACDISDVGSVSSSSKGKRKVSRGSDSPGNTSQLSSRVLGPPSWEQQAVACFMGQFTIRTVPTPTHSGRGLGWFDFLPDQFVDANQNSCLKPAVMSIAYASLAGQSALRWLMTEARKFYGAAISKINDALRHTETATQDDVLASVLLAGFYENMTGDNLDVMGSHRAGLEMLLKLRGPEQFETERGRSLFRHVRSMYRIFDYNTGSRPLAILEDFDRHEAEMGVAESSSIAALSNRVANYSTDFKAFYNTAHPLAEFAAGISSFLEKGESLKAEILQWAASLGDSSFTGLRHSSIPGLDQGPQPSFLMTYSNTWRMSTSNLFRTSLCFLNEILFLCSTSLEYPGTPRFSADPSSPTLSTRSQAYVQEARELTDELCASIPYVLDDVDSSANITADAMKSGIKAFVAIWALWVIKSSALAQRKQQQYADWALMRVGGVWGIALATHVAGLQIYSRYGVMMQD